MTASSYQALPWIIKIKDCRKEQHSPIGQEFALADPQQYPIRRCRFCGRRPRGLTFGGGWGIGLYKNTTALSGTERIREGTKVSNSLTFSQGQYRWWSQLGGPPAGWTSSQIQAVGLGKARSLWSWVSLSTNGIGSTSFLLWNIIDRIVQMWWKISHLILVA